MVCKWHVFSWIKCITEISNSSFTLRFVYLVYINLFHYFQSLTSSVSAALHEWCILNAQNCNNELGVRSYRLLFIIAGLRSRFKDMMNAQTTILYHWMKLSARFTFQKNNSRYILSMKNWDIWIKVNFSTTNPVYIALYTIMMELSTGSINKMSTQIRCLGFLWDFRMKHRGLKEGWKSRLG